MTIRTVSNLKIFLIISLLLAGNVSCNKDEYDVIPNVMVDFYIDLNDPLFFDLNAIGNHVLVNAST
ncbi:MAG: hypothetical protein K8R35_01715, partial [Bacteroidales bacterium]|nr:hypothetical protein [Bacteroidales bacterium]